jgi:hypothetical protein
MAWSNNLFYIAFVSQIYLLSYYFPQKLLARMRHVLASYPPETYPKLYPRPIEDYKKAHRGFKFMSVYFQIIAVFSIGYSLHNIKVDEMDLDVYKSEAAG